LANNDSFFNRLTRLFRSGPSIQRRVKGYDYRTYYDNDIIRGNYGYRAPFPFGRESSPFSVLGAYGILDRMARYSEFAEMEWCLHEDTKIAVPGGYKTIKELAEEYGTDKEFTVYSYDHAKKKIVPAVGKQARLTRHDHAWRVVFDSGKEIIGTADHRLLRRDGTYSTIADLRPGDAMMPFYRRSVGTDRTENRTNQYQTIYSISREDSRYGWIAEHRLLAEHVLGRKLKANEVVHHKNFLANDNRLENLEVMTETEHRHLHAAVLNGKKWSATSNGEWIAKFRKNHSEWMKKNNPAERKDVTFAKVLQWCDANGFNLYRVAKAFDVCHETVISRVKANGFSSFEDFAKAYRPTWKSESWDNEGSKNPRYRKDISYQGICNAYSKGISKRQLAKSLGCSSVPIEKRLKAEGYASWTEFVNSYENHKVVKVEYYGHIPLYDLTVDGYKNFATDSVISHNTPEIAAALNIFADETVSGDEKGKALHLYSKNPEVKKALEELYYDILNIDFNLRPWVRNLVKYGDFFLYNEIIPDIGFVNVQPIPVNELEREEGFDRDDPYSIRYKWLTRGNRYLENWQVTHMRMLGNDLFLPYGTCHEKTTKVLTSSGIKEIQHIVPGDVVLSFDLKSQKKVKSPVLGVKNSGFKNCFEFRTRHNFLRTSKEHQILVWDSSREKFDYKSAGELRLGDKLVISKEHKIENSKIKIDKTAPSGINKNGYWNSVSNIPDEVTPDFARLFGFLMGDGWITGNQVFFANGIDLKQNERYSLLLEKFSGKKANSECRQGTQTVLSSKMFGEILKRMGFAGKATTKRVPSWVFGASEDLRLAFLEGFHDADGSSFVDKWNCERRTFELSNYDLIKDLKALAQTLGFKTGKITERKSRTFATGIEENGSFRSFKTVSPSYVFYWFAAQNKQVKKHDVTNRVSDDFLIEPIVAIQNVGEHETYDIYVQDNNHNFFANGIVTHNSLLEPARRICMQLRMAEDHMLLYRVVRSPERRVFYIDVGNVAPNDVPAYMEAVKQTLRAKDLVDKSTGRIDQRNNSVSIIDDYFLPVRGNQTGTKIDTLAGGQNATAVEDVKYLQQKLFAALQVPKPYLNFDENLSAKASLAQQDIRFSRTVSILQRVIIAELNKMGMIHLYARGFDGEDLINFELRLSNPSTVAMQQKLEAIATKFEIAGAAKETKLVDEDWIQRKVLELTEDEIIKIEAGRRRDKIREVEIEAVSVAENLPKPDATIDPFHPSNYQIGGGDVAKNPPVEQPAQTVMGIGTPSPAGGGAPLGQPQAPQGPALGAPISATPFASRQKEKKSRRVGLGGRNNLSMPDFSSMLSSKNRSLTDVYDSETINLRQSITEDIELDIRSAPFLPNEMRSIFKTLDTHFEKNYANVSGQRKLLRELKEQVPTIDFELTDDADEDEKSSDDSEREDSEDSLLTETLEGVIKKDEEASEDPPENTPRKLTDIDLSTLD